MLGKLKYYGLWVPFAGGIIGYLIHRHFNGVDDDIFNAIIIGVCAGLPFQLFIWAINQLKVKNGKPMEKLGWLDAFDLYDRYTVDTGKWAAMHPQTDERLLFDRPEGYLLGKARNTNGKIKYVCASLDAPGAANILLIGGSGTGKTSGAGVMATAILSNNPDKTDHKKTYAVFIDPKGEIHRRTSYSGDGSFHIAPKDRSSWGYDPFFLLNDASSEQDVFKTAQVIAMSLIPHTKEENDPIWTNSSRLMYESFIMYGWQKLGYRNLAQVHDWILSKTVAELVSEVVENCSPSSTAYQNIIAYYGAEAATDMVSSVFGTLISRITIFSADKDLKFCIGYNPRKFNPKMAFNGNVYINIPAEELSQYACLTVLILNQLMLYIMSLVDIIDDPKRPRIQLICDETSAILEGAGRIDYLVQFLRLCRSKGAQCVIVAQSYSGLLCSLSEAETEDLASNTPYKIFLDASTPKTQRLIIDSVGKYKAKIASISGYGSTRKRTISYQDEDIITTGDLSRMGSGKEMILISSIGGFSMIQKSPWYTDKILSSIQKKIQKLQKEEIEI